MSARRLLAVVLPRLATDRLARAEPALAAQPLALWARQGNRRVLVAVNPVAARHVLPGLPLADATAMLPALLTREATPAEDAALLQTLARWATRYTPLAATDGTDALLLDISGCAHFFAPPDASPDASPEQAEGALLHDATQRLGRMGFAASAAVAGTAAAALALARALRHGAWVAPGQEFAAIAALPLALLGLEPALLQRLEGFGLASIGALAAQPRGALARRAGPEALAALDEALGHAPRPIRPLRPASAFSAAENFAEPILTAPAIGAALDRLMQQLCAHLAAQGQGARRVTLACFRTDGGVARIGIGTSAASRDWEHLARLLRPRIENLDPGLGIDRMVLAADAVEPLGANQSAFSEGVAARGEQRAELARLLDRLQGRLAPRALHRLAPRASHLPERALALADALEAPPPVATPARLFRPVRLFTPPEPISVVSLLPDGPPRRFRWKGGVVGVARVEGPERIAPEWWRDPPDTPTRDYWRVEAEEGPRYWLYREAPTRWFLHGLFA
jgi:protein ImuB